MSKELEHIINEINQLTANKFYHGVVYMGIGTAAGMIANGILPNEHYHQYPPFLRDMMNSIPNLHQYIILVDPYQENPPYITIDNNLNVQFQLVHNNNFLTKYCSSKITLYVVRKDVIVNKVYDNNNNNYDDIETNLRHLNNVCIQNNLGMIYHDFTGKRNNLLAEFFDPEIKDYLDQIVYGMSCRADHGCYFDLTNTFEPFRLDNGIVKFFNIYKYISNRGDYIANDVIARDSILFPDYMQPMIQKQKTQVVNIIKNDFRQHYLSILRLVYRVYQGREEHSVLNSFDFKQFSTTYNVMDLLNSRKYKELFDFLVIYYSSYMDKIAVLNKLDLSGLDILLFATKSDNPYTWYDEFANLGV